MLLSTYKEFLLKKGLVRDDNCWINDDYIYVEILCLAVLIEKEIMVLKNECMRRQFSSEGYDNGEIIWRQKNKVGLLLPLWWWATDYVVFIVGWKPMFVAFIIEWKPLFIVFISNRNHCYVALGQCLFFPWLMEITACCFLYWMEVNDV